MVENLTLKFLINDLIATRKKGAYVILLASLICIKRDDVAYHIHQWHKAKKCNWDKTVFRIGIFWVYQWVESNRLKCDGDRCKFLCQHLNIPCKTAG